MDPKRGAPFKFAFPLVDPTIPLQLKEKDTSAPFSRWTLGRKSNPNFALTGCGLEGHLCALDTLAVRDFLKKFQDDAYFMVKHDVGVKPLDRFLQDPSEPISTKFLQAMHTAFEITLAKARAVRGMTIKGGYAYTPDGQFVDLRYRPDRMARSRSYEGFIYSAQPILEWKIEPVDSGILTLNHVIKDTGSKLPIDNENLGADIGTNPNLKLIAEIGRFGHPIIPIIMNSL